MMKRPEKEIGIYSLTKVSPFDHWFVDLKDPIEFLRNIDEDVFLGNGHGLNIYAARIDNRIGIFDRGRLKENNHETYIGELLETKKELYDEPMERKLPRIAEKAEEKHKREVILAYKKPELVAYRKEWYKPKISHGWEDV